MPFTESTCGNLCLHIGGEVKQAQRVGNGGACLAGDHRNLFLRQTKFVSETSIRVRCFNWRQIAALNVLNECEFET